jgi:TonB family protein
MWGMIGPIISADWVGRVIDGRFALLEWLGGGGRSGVFRTELPQPVEKRAAIKLIAAAGDEADACIAGWAKAANLSHPRLTRVHRSGRFQFGSIELAYVVTEYADEVLSQIIPERPLTGDETRAMLDPVIDALEYLHGKGLVHAHLKPSNILVVDEQLKISGDNVAPAGAQRNRFLSASVYDAPELAGGRMAPEIDVWALGATLVEALTQRPLPWDRERSSEPVVPEQMPRLFATIAQGCLRRDPKSRLTLAEIKALLESNQPIEFVQKVDEAVPAPIVEDDEPGRSPSKLRSWPLVAGLVVVLVVSAFMIVRNHSKPAAPQAIETAQTPIAPSKDTDTAQSGGTRAATTGKVAQRAMPDITPSARKTIHGAIVVTVRVSVNANGEVIEAKLRSAEHSRYFANAALKAAWGWKFEPPRKHGQALPSVWTLRFKLRRSGDEASAAEERS